jgi:outer membrane protein TolC
MRWLVVLGVLFAEIVSGSAEVLRLEQAIDLAITNDVRLVPYASELQLAQARADAALPYKNPELRLGTELNGNDPGQRASVRFYPPNPWQVKADKKDNGALLGQELARYQSAVLNTTVEVMTTYQELQCLEKEQKLVEQIMKMKATFAAQMDKQLSAAVATQAQGLLAHWELLEAQEEVTNFAAKANLLKQTLAAQIGRSAEDLTILPLEKMDSFIPVNPEKLVAEALQNRAELQLLNAQRAQADARLRSAKSAAVPWLNFVELGYRTGSDQWELQAGFEIPIFTLKGTEKMLSYETVSRRNIEIEKQTQAIRFEVEAAAKAYNTTVSEWIALQKHQAVLMKKTRIYLAQMPPSNPQRMSDQLSLEEKLIRAEFKTLALHRRINQAKILLISLVGKSI